MTRTVLFALSVIAFLIGGLILIGSKSAVHEALAGISWIIASIFFSARAVVGSIVRMREEIVARLEGTAAVKIDE